MANAAPPAADVEAVDELGVPNAFISRRMKPFESPIAVVEGEDRLNATACGPCRVGDPAHRRGGQV